MWPGGLSRGLAAHRRLPDRASRRVSGTWALLGSQWPERAVRAGWGREPEQRSGCAWSLCAQAVGSGMAEVPMPSGQSSSESSGPGDGWRSSHKAVSPQLTQQMVSSRNRCHLTLSGSESGRVATAPGASLSSGSIFSPCPPPRHSSCCSRIIKPLPHKVSTFLFNKDIEFQAKMTSS